MKIAASAHGDNRMHVNQVPEAVAPVAVVLEAAAQVVAAVKALPQAVKDRRKRRNVDHVLQSRCRSTSTDWANVSSPFRAFRNASTPIFNPVSTALCSISKPVDRVRAVVVQAVVAVAATN